MKVKISKIIHGVEGEAPFVGAILHSDTKDRRSMRFGGKELFQTIKEHDMNEGIILTGDWDKQPDKLLEILKKVKGAGLKVAIYTELNFQLFTQELGICAWEKTYKTKLRREKNPYDNDPMLGFMGCAMLDLYLGHMEFTMVTNEKQGKVKHTIKENRGGEPIEEVDNGK